MDNPCRVDKFLAICAIGKGGRGGFLSTARVAVILQASLNVVSARTRPAPPGSKHGLIWNPTEDKKGFPSI